MPYIGVIYTTNMSSFATQENKTGASGTYSGNSVTTHTSLSELYRLATKEASQASEVSKPSGTGSSSTEFWRAFKKACEDQDQEKEHEGETWNGDVNLKRMGPQGTDFQARVLEANSKAVRGRTIPAFKADLDAIFASIDAVADNASRAQLWSIFFRWLFHLRKIRGLGKGERLLFTEGLMHVFDTFPMTCVDLLPLVWQYGYWGDVMNLFVLSIERKKSTLMTGILTLIKEQLDTDLKSITGDRGVNELQVSDLKALKTEWSGLSEEERVARVKTLSNPLTLLGKWISAEGHQKDKKAGVTKVLVAFLFYEGVDLTSMFQSDDKSVRLAAKRKMDYGLMKFRLMKGLLNIVLDTPEVKMCDGRWSELNIETIASKLMLKCRKAFLNEKLKERLSEADWETGNRVNSEDRKQCRKNMLASMEDGALKGAVLQVTEIADKIFQGMRQKPNWGYKYHGGSKLVVTEWEVDPSKMTLSDRKVLCIQWQKALEEVMRIIQEAKDKAVEEGTPLEMIETFEKALAVIDMSGSMVSAGVMAKALGLGIMCSELSTLKDVAIAFSEEPSLIDLSGCTDVVDKFVKVLCSPWGYSTDADKVYQKVIEISQTAQVAAGAPSITPFLPGAVLMLTDGQFNSMCPSLGNKTLLQRCDAHLQEVAPGATMWRTIFWNLNGNAPGFQARKDTPNVQMVSGYSQNLFRQILVGDYELEVDEKGAVSIKVDPWLTFMKAVDDPELMPVLDVLDKSQEGVMMHFRLP